MKDYKKILVPNNSNVFKSIEVIDKGMLRFAIVVGDNNVIEGTVTDGDIRRGILKGIPLSESIVKVMNIDPVFIYENQVAQANDIMKQRQINHLPVVNAKRQIVGLITSAELQNVLTHENPIVLMAGGFGKRLGDLTKDCPKPMLKVGKKPILEIIIDEFKSFGFKNFYLTVNYKADIIKDYFKDGSHLGIHIEYIDEEKPLGTAGSLGSLPKNKIKHPIIIMNGDLLTKVNLLELKNFHEKNNAIATMGLREYDFEVPFGVVEVSGLKMKQIVEKPSHKFFVNAGLYVLNPEVLDLVKPGEYLDMPNLLQKITKDQDGVFVFPIREYWLDIGRVDDFEKASFEYDEHF